MTTTVVVQAHCGEDTEVTVEVRNGDEIVEKSRIADGEESIVYAYDEREIFVKEVPRNSSE